MSRIEALLAEHPVIDGHNDLPIAFYGLCGYDLDAYDLAGPVPQLHTDLPRLRAGHVGAQFWSLWVPQDEHAVRRTFEQLDFVRRLVERFPSDLQLASSADDVDAAIKAGRVASLMGMEGGHSIGESLGVLRVMRALGVRYMTLTHNNNVSWADSATDEPVLGGLNEFGEDVVREMNRIGMLVDLSHVSADTMRHALRVTTAPVIFSHSSSRAVCDVPRNAPDDVLETLTGNDGVCMVTFVPYFVSQAYVDWLDGMHALAKEHGLEGSEHREKVESMYGVPRPEITLADVVEHVEHVREVAGVDHIGLGGDYDGCPEFPVELPDVASYPVLFSALADRGWSDEELGKLAGGNILRVLRAADDAATA
ncbi:membrane dipeptidase [Kribbella sp. VKM Ac-2569]|uniref:dipeptidase n=1 Tax=Kribbella sp. VKM Ac-2569 TaxID=2512220 RepID=UPI00102CC14E|nr:dipeptidase [Kribbella sp. VKM Ac-2569]RZT26462.1 membrane dipeptidase [Kribbella sp. VKM Ac-2569]